MSKNHLNPYEWMVVVSLLLLMAIITFVTQQDIFESKPVNNSEWHFVYNNEISVKVDGAVETKGPIKVKKGSTIKDVLGQVKPLKNADLQNLFLEKKVRDGQVINVPEKKTITINIKGAVKYPGSVEVPQGTTLEGLLEFIEFAEDANQEKLRKKRKLKNGEIVHIAHKKKLSRTMLEHE